jgi:hypothetical protein
MNKPVFITITPELVGKFCLKVFGEVIFPAHLGAAHPCEFLADDVGRRIYLFQPHMIVIEPDEEKQRREALPTIREFCQLRDWTVWPAEPDGPFALSELRLGGAVTPWFESLIQLEEYCKENVERFRRQVSVN